GITALGDPDSIAGAVTKGNGTLLSWLNEHLATLGKEQFFHADFEQTLRPVYGDSASAEELVVEGGQL
ncbi:MAG: amino acid ABC transporter substrate-binding protein, partial [Propionibacterium sp.]|nr:amino acid ABC transporter substrate-binding protein [Propionibacterium sp.]